MIHPISRLKAALEFARAFGKRVAVALVTGLVCGLVGSAFYASVASATDLRAAHPWLLWLLPAVGACIALLYKYARLDGLGTDTVIEAIQAGRGISVLLVPAIIISTAATNLSVDISVRDGS